MIATAATAIPMIRPVLPPFWESESERSETEESFLFCSFLMLSSFKLSSFLLSSSLLSSVFMLSSKEFSYSLTALSSIPTSGISVSFTTVRALLLSIFITYSRSPFIALSAAEVPSDEMIVFIAVFSSSLSVEEISPLKASSFCFKLSHSAPDLPPRGRIIFVILLLSQCFFELKAEYFYCFCFHHKAF